MHDYPEHIVAVTGVVMDEAGRVLLVRTPRREWEPPGGQVERGEDLVQALEREVLEESGCRVAVGGLIGVYSNVGVPNQVILAFECAWIGGEPCGGHECLDARWFTPDEALRVVTHEAQLARLRDALTGEPGIVYRAYTTRPYVVLTERGILPQRSQRTQS